MSNRKLTEAEIETLQDDDQGVCSRCGGPLTAMNKSNEGQTCIDCQEIIDSQKQ